MAPPGILLEPTREDILSNSEVTDSDDDTPVVKIKVPLNKQYQALEEKHQPASKGAVIDWLPSRKNYMERVSRRLKAGIPNVSLPDGFPATSSHPSCWTADEVRASDLIRTFSDPEIAEIEAALAHFKALNVSKESLSPSTFPLPTLKAELEAVAQNVHNGRGLSILRGLNPAKYNFQDNVLIYAGIASYVGPTRGTQDNDGNILVHIKNVGARVAPDDQRQSPYANNAQPFHNDLGDMIALYCMDRAMSGGISKVASAAKVYNELASTRPDLIREMADGNWVFDKHDATGEYYERPILFSDPDKQRVFFCFSRRQLTGSTISPRPSHFPPLTEAKAEAIDAVHFAAEKHALSIQLEKGDIQFSNNLALFHAREAFQDGEDSQRRHLIRMWLRNEDLAWTTPEGLQRPWEEIYGNIRTPVWHMAPEHGRAHVINSRLSCHG